MSALLQKVRDAVSPHRSRSRDRKPEPANESFSSIGSVDDEERGRGRTSKVDTGDYVISTGRGGAGNIHRSKSPHPHGEDTRSMRLDEESPHRPRGIVPEHVGRGGVGNVRSPSRDPVVRERTEEEYKRLQQEDAAIQARRREEDVKGPHTSGRGGFGNIGHAAG